MSKKNKKIDNKIVKNNEVIDLTKFINANSVKFDPEGMYTGTTAETFYGDDLDEPVQDADDL